MPLLTRAFIKTGMICLALAFPHPFKDKPVKLPEWLKEKADALPSQPTKLVLIWLSQADNLVE